MRRGIDPVVLVLSILSIVMSVISVFISLSR
jgi:Na+-transporting methylmalonyl-CoA/oxaloacetate decarboxylase gamma subunit